MLDDPRVNFAISQPGAAPGVNHLGIQVESDAELSEMQSRLDALQPELTKEEGVACCYAKSDKYWINDPSGIAWETFHTLDSVPVWGAVESVTLQSDPVCCAPVTSVPVPVTIKAASRCGSGGDTKGNQCC